MMISAIMEKEGRVTAEDVRAAWNKYANPNAGGWVSEPFEGVLLKMAKTGIPATDLGRYCDYAGLNSFARACHPIGLINAGNVEGAKEDILQVGQLYQTTNSRGLKWACVTGVAIAEGTKPGATVDSVIGAIFDHCDPDVVVKEIDEQLKKAAGCSDILLYPARGHAHFRQLRICSIHFFIRDYICFVYRCNKIFALQLFYYPFVSPAYPHFCIPKGSTGNRSYTAHWRYNGGGGSGYSYYTIKATAGTGGSISPSGNVSVREGRDQTFTITPDKGYAVANVKIDGKSIGAVKSYTFENVSRTHTIEVIFMKANGNPQTGVFVDVATGSYYEDAVDCAVLFSLQETNQ